MKMNASMLMLFVVFNLQAESLENEEKQIERVTVLYKGESENHFVETVNLERVNFTLADDLNDTFKFVPSIQVGTGSRNGQKIFMRGIEDLHINIKVDGARLGSNTFHHQGRFQIDPFLLKSVTINNGISPASSGPGAIGGSVLFETVDPHDLIANGNTWGSSIRARGETSSDLYGLTASTYGLLTEHLGMLAYINYSDNANVRAGGGEEMISTDGSKENYLFKVSLIDYYDHNLRISINENNNIGGALRANFPWQSNVGTIRAEDNQKSYTKNYVVNHGYNFNNHIFRDVKSSIYQNTSGIKRDLLAGRTKWETRSTGGNITVNTVNNINQFEYEILFGVDYFKDENLAFELSKNLKEHSRNFGQFIQSRFDLNNVIFNFGARRDSYSALYANKYKFSGTDLSPNATAEWIVLDGDNFLKLSTGYENVKRGGRLNQAAWLQKYADELNFGDKGYLLPEVALKREYGLLYRKNMASLAGFIEFKLSHYNNDLENYLATTGEGINGITDKIYNVDGIVTNEGYEAILTFNNASSNISIAHIQNDLRDYNGQPMDTTGDSARLGASTGDKVIFDYLYMISDDISVGYTIIGVKRLKDTRMNRPRKPGYVTHDVQTEIKSFLDDDITLTLSLDNIFDKRYAQHTTVRIFDNVLGELASWESGRNLKIGLRWDF